MTALEEYLNVIEPEIKTAVAGALPGMADKLCDWIYRMSWDKVYSYPAGSKCAEERRHRIGAKENLEVTIGTNTIAVKNITEMQFEEGPPEVEVVEEGMEEYRNDFPGPRPFMQPALDWYIRVDGDDDLATALRSAGFEVKQDGMAGYETDSDFMGGYDPDYDFTGGY